MNVQIEAMELLYVQIYKKLIKLLMKNNQMADKEHILYNNILIIHFFIIKENLIFDVICYLLHKMESLKDIGIKKDIFVHHQKNSQQKV